VTDCPNSQAALINGARRPSAFFVPLVIFLAAMLSGAYVAPLNKALYSSVMGNCEGSTGWNFERGQVRPPSTPQLDRVAADLSATTASSRSGNSFGVAVAGLTR
jgi:hypothetical protein